MLLARKLMNSVSEFTPDDLFASSEVGFWFDPSDASTMNTLSDQSGTTPGVGDPVGYIADKSGNGFHATQTSTSRRPTLQQDGSGNYYLDFDESNVEHLNISSADISSATAVNIFSAVQDDLNDTFRIILEGAGGFVKGNILFCVPGASPSEGFESIFRDTSSNNKTIISSGYPSDIYVVSNTIDLSGGTHELRIDGAQVDIDTGGFTRTNFSSQSMDLGRRPGSAFSFHGKIYQFILRGALSTSQEISDAEAWAAERSGATL